MPYKELIHGYGYEAPQDGPTTGRRVYLYVPTGGETLPIVGTSTLPNENGVAMPGVICRKKRVVRDPSDPHPQLHFEYSTTPPGRTDGVLIPTDPGDRSFEAYAETLAFENKDGGGWIGVSQTPGDGNDQPLTDTSIYKRVVLVDFTIPRANLTTASYNSLLSTIRTHAGTINSAAFEGYAEGQVYFEGPRGATFTTADGQKRWSLELRFKARLLTGEGDLAGPITKDDWLYIWDNYWVRPRNSDGLFLYRKTDFSELT
jgi:hypothetical protein